MSFFYLLWQKQNLWKRKFLLLFCRFVNKKKPRILSTDGPNSNERNRLFSENVRRGWIDEKNFRSIDVHKNVLVVGPTMKRIVESSRKLENATIYRPTAFAVEQILFVDRRRAQSSNDETIFLREIRFARRTRRKINRRIDQRFASNSRCFRTFFSVKAEIFFVLKKRTKSILFFFASSDFTFKRFPTVVQRSIVSFHVDLDSAVGRIGRGWNVLRNIWISKSNQNKEPTSRP